MRNHRRLAALLVVALAAVIASGGFVASNMGFKLNYPLQAASGTCPGGGCISKSGTQSIGLPYNQQVGINNAKDLFQDLAASGFTMIGSNIQDYNVQSDQNDPYTFGSPNNFGLVPGTGYLVQIQSTGDYIVVGSHDPGLSIPLQAAAGTCPGGGCISKSGTQRYSHPYHAVSANAKDIFLEIGGAVGENVQNYNVQSDQNDPYTFGSPNNFALTPGKSYLIQVQSTRSFVPAHY